MPALSDAGLLRRAAKDVEQKLWERFRAAQDAFFTARNAHFSVQDEELRGNQKVKEDILGGLQVMVGDRFLDLSVSSRVADLSKALESSAN